MKNSFFFIVTSLCILLFSGCNKDDAVSKPLEISDFKGTYTIEEVVWREEKQDTLYDSFEATVDFSNDTLYFDQSHRTHLVWVNANRGTEVINLHVDLKDSVLGKDEPYYHGKIKSRDHIEVYYHYTEIITWGNVNSHNVTQQWRRKE